MRHLRIIRLLAVALTAGACLGGTALALAASGGAAISPSQWDVVFDDVPVGSTSAPQEVTFTNNEHGPVRIGQAELTGPHTQDFLISSDTCSGKRLDEGEHCKVAIRFRPIVKGTRVAHLHLPHDGSGCGIWITLAGSGPNQAAARAASCGDDSSSKPPTGQPSSNPTTTTSGDSAQTSSTTLASSAIGLPAASTTKACTSRRSFKIRINPPRGMRFTKVTVRLNSKLISVKRGKKLTASVSLKGLPRGRFTLRVIATTASGRSLSRTRHYVTCVQNKG